MKAEKSKWLGECVCGAPSEINLVHLNCFCVCAEMAIFYKWLFAFLFVLRIHNRTASSFNLHAILLKSGDCSNWNNCIRTAHTKEELNVDSMWPRTGQMIREENVFKCVRLCEMTKGKYDKMQRKWHKYRDIMCHNVKIMLALSMHLSLPR